MNKPALLRLIADEMEANPNGWWLGFEWRLQSGEWTQTMSDHEVLRNITSGTPLRPRPRTVTITVEVPEPMRVEPERGRYYYFVDTDEQWSSDGYAWDGDENDRMLFKRGIWDTEAKAKQAADAIFGALGAK